MSRLAGPLSVIGVVILAIVFTSQNGGERVTLDLGVFVLYGVPVTLVAFGGLLIGMLVMLGAGVQSDLKVRSILRQRLVEENPEEPDLVDQAQRDLFLHAASIEPSTPTDPIEPSDELERDVSAPPSEPWLPEPPVVSIDELAPAPESAPPPDPPQPGTPSHPAWRDMEHGDPMD